MRQRFAFKPEPFEFSPEINEAEERVWIRKANRRRAQVAQPPDWLHRAVLLNRRYARSLGWQQHYERIAQQQLGFTNFTPDDRSFAEAVARWQRAQGLTESGVIGPRTWTRMRGFLASGAGLQSPANAAVNIQMLKDNMVRLANQEWERWGRGTIKEWDDRLRPVLQDYWLTGTGRRYTEPGWWSKHPWSAAFISWIMKKAGAGDSFRYAGAHAVYIKAAKDNRLANNSNPFKAYRANEIMPHVGDLVCKSRAGSGANYENIRPGHKTHCDIVTEVRPNRLATIGGNVKNSVSKTFVSTKADGYINHPGYFAVIRIGAPSPLDRREIGPFEVYAELDRETRSDIKLSDQEWEEERGRRMPIRAARFRSRPVGRRRFPTRPWRPARLLWRRGLAIFPEPSIIEPQDADYIRWVQSSLNRIMGLRLPVDGILETETRSAIRGFQEQQGLPVTGTVGTETEQALVAAGADPPPETQEFEAFETELSGRPLGTLTLIAPEQLRFSYTFTPEDAVWTARFIVGEAGGRNDLDNQAVIWAMFNRYAFFTHKYYRTFHSFIRAYSTPLQPVLRSWRAAKRHVAKPEFVRTGGYYKSPPAPPAIPRGQLKRFLSLQATPWNNLPQSARSLADQAMKGEVPNPVGNASEFGSTYVYFHDNYGRYPNDEEWRRYTEAYARSKGWIWIGPVAGLNQKKNTFFIQKRVAGLPKHTVRVVRPSSGVGPSEVYAEFDRESNRYDTELSDEELKEEARRGRSIPTRPARFRPSPPRGTAVTPTGGSPIIMPPLVVHVRPFVVLDRFEFDRATLPAKHLPIIKRIAHLVVASQISAQPIRTIRVVGHTDPIGRASYNVGLGDRRAKEVQKSLTKAINDLSPTAAITIVPQSLGETRPIASSPTPEGRARNRRVEVFVPLTCQSFFAQYDLRFLPGDSLFGIPAYPNMTTDEKNRRSNDVGKMAAELEIRRDKRASEAIAGRVVGANPVPFDGSVNSLHSIARRLSSAQLELYREYFPDGSGGIDFETFQQCFEAFANGELRSPHPEAQSKGVGEPNSDFYFLFAEFAFLCVDSRIDNTVWESALNAFVKTQEIFMHVYRPNPVSPTPAVSAVLPACPVDAQGKPRQRRALGSFRNRNFKPVGSSTNVGEGQSNQARKQALRTKYAPMGVDNLRKAAAENMLRAQCMP